VNSFNSLQRILDFSNGPNAYEKQSISFKFDGNGSAISSTTVAALNGLGGIVLTANNLINLNQWYMLTSVLSGTNGYIYINGLRAKMALLNHPQVLTRQFNYFGKSPFNSNLNLDAIVDDIEIFNVALSPDDIKSKYQAALSQGMLRLNILI